MSPLVAILALTAGLGMAAPADEAVPSLPLWGTPPSHMWSGFLDAGAAEPGTMLHYWYSQKEGDATDSGAGAPVVLWLNGGPGSSSILGMLQEMGPLLINATGGLMANPYAWTKQANLLVLESPAGVGYSYCAAMAAGTGQCSNTDETTAAAARAALQDFYTKFPELLAAPLYITGESYAGVYIPTLADELLQNAPEVPLKGVAAGDPCTDTPSQAQSMNMLWYAHKHGFVPDQDYTFLTDTCKYVGPTALLAYPQWKMGNDGKWLQPELSSSNKGAGAITRDSACVLAERKFLMTTSKAISQGWDGAYINELDLFSDASALDWTLPGTLNYYNAEYMNRDDVKAALHVDTAPVGAWPGPPAGWSYTKDWDACNADASYGTLSMVDFYRTIAPQLDTTIVFNGDVDPCVSYEGTRHAIGKVGFAELSGGAYRPWFINKTKADVSLLMEKPSLFGPDLEVRDAGAQFGGHVVSYVNNLHFVTVHGAGHMVPQFRPMEGARVLSQLLANLTYPFAPPLPSDDELLAYSASEFNAEIDTWTDAAKADVD